MCSTSEKLPVTLVCPVRNCRADLPSHVAHLRTLAPRVAEILFVDSQSTDGTMGYLRETMADTEARFLDHPPGLYQSWNYGIAQATQSFLTVATVGDPLPADSLVKLHETMVRFDADVVVSAPSFLGPDGKPLAKKWPVHDLIEVTGMTEPTRISPAVWMMYSVFHLPASLLSSSAGNLYRTRFLQDHPFPVVHGHAGDSVWSLEMSFLARWVIDPAVKSWFWEHQEAQHKVGFTGPIVDGIRNAAREFYQRSQDRLIREGVTEPFLKEIQESLLHCAELTLIKQQYRALRKPFVPWFLQPGAAELRRRKRQIIDVKRHRRQLLVEYTRDAIHSTAS